MKNYCDTRETDTQRLCKKEIRITEFLKYGRRSSQFIVILRVRKRKKHDIPTQIGWKKELTSTDLVHRNKRLLCMHRCTLETISIKSLRC